MSMRRSIVGLLVTILGASACGVGSGPEERIVRVDLTHDEFASHYWRYFPGTVEARPGDEVVFRQEWTGEPHTVTFGTIADDAIDAIEAVERKYSDADELEGEALERVEAEFETAYGELPTFDPYVGAAAQNAAQPCYLDRGRPPKDQDEACVEREQPQLTGRQSYYSSGFIPPSGAGGNTFRMRLSDDIAPGSYRYYCVIHFPLMQGELEVRPKGAELPSAVELNRRARREIEELASPLRKAFAAAQEAKVEYRGEELRPPLAGYHVAEEYSVAIDEFVPKEISTSVGEPVTWTIVGAHTISFDVPRYMPIYTVRADATVERNPKVDEPAGGSPDVPPVDFTRHKLEVDGGMWDGEGFFSSGLLGSEPFSTYTLRFSKAGRYRYACLVHPTMVGNLEVVP